MTFPAGNSRRSGVYATGKLGEESACLTKPSRIVWCDGSQAENDRLTDDMLRDGEFIELSQKSYSHCYLHRSNPNDVARTEGLTYICTRQKDDAGPTNNWMAPEDGKKSFALFLTVR